MTPAATPPTPTDSFALPLLLRAVDVVIGAGCVELALAAAVLAIPGPALLIGISGWKLATESLFLLSGATAPRLEVIERGGSYLAPLAFAVLLWRRAPRSLPAPATLALTV